MTRDERVKEAALAFAMSKPIEWDGFREKWLATHPEEPEKMVETPKTEEKPTELPDNPTPSLHFLDKEESEVT